MNTDMEHPRYIESVLKAAIDDTPVILIHGPRQCGKSTLAKRVGYDLGYEYTTFDDDTLMNAALSDPAGFVKGLPERVILDEIQRVPEIFTSLKLAVDNSRTPGRFILTGSANVLLLPKLSDSLAGRMEVLRLHPLSQSELERKPNTFVTDLLRGEVKAFSRTLQLEDLADRIVSGGFPAALTRTLPGRKSAWYRDYIKTLINRDIRDFSRISRLDIIPRLLTATAGQTAHLLNVTELASPFNVSRPTIRDYISLLTHIFIIEEIQPWYNNNLKRVIKTPKLHLCDTGLISSLLGINAQTLLDDHMLFGQILETFAYQELHRLSSWMDESVNFLHYRDKDMSEVDVVIEKGRDISGVEIKLSATVRNKDFRGLRRLKSSAGKRFKSGVILYNGDSVVSFEDDLYAVPLSVLWN